MNYKMNIFLLGLMLILGACTTTISNEQENADNGFIKISKAQFLSEKMKMATADMLPFANKLHFTGTIVPSRNGVAVLSAPVAGTIKNIQCNIGQSVNKGKALIEIAGYDIINLQKEYAESAALLQRLKVDYERAKILYSEKIGVQKDFVQTESAYKAELAMNKALKMKIENANLNAGAIAEGNFFSSYTLLAPITGSITQVDAIIGQSIDLKSELAKIVDETTFRLSIPIFGKDIHKIYKSQKVTFGFSDDKTISHYATISNVGKSINPVTKSVNCFAQLDNQVSYVSNQFVEGNIILSTDSALAVPKSAMLKSENEYFILLFEKETEEEYVFKKEKISMERETKEYIELNGTVTNTDKILIKGIYNIVIE